MTDETRPKWTRAKTSGKKTSTTTAEDEGGRPIGTAGRRGGTAGNPTDAGEPAGTSAARRKPHGREEVVESIIDATLSLWSAQGPAALTMRGIAARAGVNYGLVHRHFGTKEAVIRAAMEQVVMRSREFVRDSQDMRQAIDEVLPRSTGAHARLLAWATLQYVLDDVLPENDVFLERLRELGLDLDTDDPDESVARAGSVIAMLYGWRLFGPYLARGLGLEHLDRATLDRHMREHMLTIIGR